MEKVDKLKNLTLDFAIKIVEISKKIKQNNEFELSSQLIRSGTSIGANIREANYAQSRADFVSKMKIALKESNETSYWLELLVNTNYLTQEQYQELEKECKEIRITIIKSLKTVQQL